jgi:hypothetical protein
MVRKPASVLRYTYIVSLVLYYSRLVNQDVMSNM